MTFSQMFGLTEGTTAASLQDRSPDTVINRSEDSATAHTPPSQATLLGIPQDLRNKIYQYVYDQSGAKSNPVKTRLIDTSWSIRSTFRPGSTIGAAVNVPIHQAAPSKKAVLVCRQLYNEMSRMQAAAFRQYWSESTFDLGGSSNLTFGNRYCASTNKDLQHVKHFVLDAPATILTIRVELHFQAGKSIATFCLPDRFRAPADRAFGRPVSQGPQRVVGFEDQMCTQSLTGAFTAERATMDPECGSSFTAQDLFDAALVIRKSIFSLGPIRGFGPL